MASPVCVHLAVLGVVSAGVWIINLWKLLWAIYCFMQGQNVYVYRLYIYIGVIVCKYENLLLCVETLQST